MVRTTQAVREKARAGSGFWCVRRLPLVREGCAKKILATLMRRAYRRPVTDADLMTPIKFSREGRKDGGHEAGVELALRAILVSPEFLFRVEQDPVNIAPATAYRVGDLELASRLSFFLWSSIPDDELLDAAVRGRLRDPAVMERQVRDACSWIRGRARW